MMWLCKLFGHNYERIGDFESSIDGISVAGVIIACRRCAYSPDSINTWRVDAMKKRVHSQITNSAEYGVRVNADNCFVAPPTELCDICAMPILDEHPVWMESKPYHAQCRIGYEELLNTIYVVTPNKYEYEHYTRSNPNYGMTYRHIYDMTQLRGTNGAKTVFIDTEGMTEKLRGEYTRFKNAGWIKENQYLRGDYK